MCFLRKCAIKENYRLVQGIHEVQERLEWKVGPKDRAEVPGGAEEVLRDRRLEHQRFTLYSYYNPNLKDRRTFQIFRFSIFCLKLLSVRAKKKLK